MLKLVPIRKLASKSSRTPVSTFQALTSTMAAPTVTATPYRHYIQPEADAEFPAEAGRYHLYLTYSCPFACRAFAARNLKGLEDIVSISIAHPVFQRTKPDDASDDHKGWTFVDPATQPTFTGYDGKEYSSEGCIPDTVLNTKYVRDIYEKVAPKEEGRRYTVPLLWDKKNQKIVSSESADILRTFNTGFRDLVPSNVDLLPEALVEEIEKMNAGVVDSLSSGVFKVVSTKDEESRAEALASYFTHIQTADDILAKSRFLVGDAITESDIRLFHSLIRFDVIQRESDKFQLSQYPNVVNYLRNLYQTPALKKTVSWPHLKLMLINYLPNTSPTGPLVDYDAAHDRATRSTN